LAQEKTCLSPLLPSANVPVSTPLLVRHRSRQSVLTDSDLEVVSVILWFRIVQIIIITVLHGVFLLFFFFRQVAFGAPRIGLLVILGRVALAGVASASAVRAP